MIVLSFSENSVYKSLLDKQITNKGIQKFTNESGYFVYIRPKAHKMSYSFYL